MQRLEYIDKLKGVTILLVVMGHLAEHSMGIKSSAFNVMYGCFHMPMFMFLSGIFAYKTFTDYSLTEIGAWIRKKFLRVLVPFITVGGFYGLVNSGNPLDVYVGTLGGYWFLPALFMCMLLGLVVNMLACRFTPRLTFVILLAAYGAVCAAYVLGLRFPYFLHFLKMFPYFYLGAMFTKYSRVKRMMVESNTAYSVTAIITVVMFLMWHSLPHTFNFTGLFIIVLLLQLFIKYDTKIPHILSVVGRYSLEIYVFHWFFLPTLPGIKAYMESVPKATFLYNGNIVLMIVLTLAIAAVIAALCMAVAIAIKHSRWLDAMVFGNIKGII